MAEQINRTSAPEGPGFASPSRGEEDAPRVSADFWCRQMPRSIGEALTRSARQVGVSLSRATPPPPPGTPSDLARPLAYEMGTEMGELSPWRSVLPPLYCEGNAFAAGGGKASSQMAFGVAMLSNAHKTGGRDV